MFKNRDINVENDFGNEWKAFDQNNLNNKESHELFFNYFEIFPFDSINKNSEGFDMGCGSGRWAKQIAPNVKILNCLDPSIKALEVAKKNLLKNKNCKYLNESVTDNSIKNNSQDFGYCLGVLHHIPDTQEGLNSCVKKLKTGAPFLLYLYYRFDNKPKWFKFIWTISDFLRKLISKSPFKIKLLITTLIAITVYLPLARTSLLLSKMGFDISNFPISFYSRSSLYTMKTDALDRFGTRLEHRFTKIEIVNMMEKSGLTNIKFSEKTPYWVAVGEKK